MCDPISATLGVVTGGLGIAQAAQGYDAAEDAAYAQQRANRRLAIYNNERYLRAVDYQQRLGEFQSDNYYKNAASIKEDYNLKIEALAEQTEQIRVRTLNEISKASESAARGSSMSLARSSETGTTGNSMMLQRQQYDRAEAEFANISFNNLQNIYKQKQREAMSIRAASQNMLNRAMPAPMAPIDPPAPVQNIPQPSAAPFVLQGISGILGGIGAGFNLNSMMGANLPGTGVGGGSGGSFPFSPSYGSDPNFVGPLPED